MPKFTITARVTSVIRQEIISTVSMEIPDTLYLLVDKLIEPSGNELLRRYVTETLEGVLDFENYEKYEVLHVFQYGPEGVTELPVFDTPLNVEDKGKTINLREF